MKHLDNSAVASTQRVYDAIVELHNAGQRATRHTVQELTGLSLVKVDDRIKALVEREQIKRFLKGEYVPVEVHPPMRAISKTLMAGGLVKIEIGDDVLTLTPAEDRALSMLMAGAAAMVAQIETGMAVREMATTMVAKVDQLQERVNSMPSADVAADLARAARTIERVTAAARASVRVSPDQSALDLE